MVTRAKGSSWNSADNLGYATLTDYLAVGDGSTDCTAAFVAAAATGLPIFIPTGTFVISPEAIATASYVFGCGWTSVLKLKTGSNAAFLTLTSTSSTILRNLKLDCNKAGQTGSGVHGVSISGGSTHLLDSLLIVNSLGDGINISGAAADVDIRNTYITGFVKSGITVENANRVSITGSRAFSSDAAAYPGDGFTLAPTAGGNAVSSILFSGCRSYLNVGRGFSAVGYGSKNVTNTILSDCIAESNTSHGFHLLTAQQILLANGISKSNGGDGFRLEGDVVQSRVSGIANLNTGYGCREVVSGSTPNYNDLVGIVAVGNTASNTITKVGASSLIPY